MTTDRIESALEAAFLTNCLQHPDELREFAALILDRGVKTVLEIGYHTGGTRRFFEALGCIVTTIDQTYPHKQRPAGRAILGDSHHPETLTLAGVFGPYDLLFIDGDHSFDGVAADYRDYAPLVVPGGLIAFHDAYPTSPEAVEAYGIHVPEFVATLPGVQLIHAEGATGYGIALIETAKN